MKTLKTRFYEKNVVSAQPKLKEVMHRGKIMVIKNIAILLSGVIISIAISVILWYKVGYVPSICILPGTFKLLFRLAANLKELIELYAVFCLDEDNYFQWMNVQIKKEYPNKPKDCQKAEKIFSEYYDKPEQAEKIHSMLTEELRKKPPFPLTISVLCGLLFLFDCKGARDIIFKAKYKHGAAGNMIFNMWIFYYDGQTELSHDDIAKEFTAFWTDKKPKF